MARLNHTEAAHRVRMTHALLKWCTKYAPRRDGTKLAFASDGTIAEEELVTFDAHLRADWGDRYVPAGITKELQREAGGKCALCEATQPLEEAHVNRKDHEAGYYCQHPHNLLLLCRNCHGRYDSVKDEMVTHEIVSHRKEVLQRRLLEAIDLEIRMAEEVDKVIAPFRGMLQSVGPQSFWSARRGAAALGELKALSGSLGAPAPQAAAGVDQLRLLSGSLALLFPLAAAKVESLIGGLGTDAEAWDSLDEGPAEPGYCENGDDSPALVSTARCSNCGEEEDTMWRQEPVRVAEEDGELVAFFEDARGNEYTPCCSKCGRRPLAFEFEQYCGYCTHREDKIADE